MSNFRADLHCHTSCSDGTHSPEELLHHAKEIGLSGLSITDHDTIKAYETAALCAIKLGISLISGIEFSASQDDISVHTLGYSFDLKNEKIQDLCNRHKQRRHERNRAILEKLSEYNMPIDESELQGQDTIGRPHIAQAMVNHGYIKDINEGFKKYLGEGKLCFVKGSPLTVEETLEAIHDARGFAVIAHPHLMRHQRTLKHILTMNFDGIECYYARFPAVLEEKWIKIAKEKRWLKTGGSDFHGDIKPNNPLGASWVNEETFRILEERHRENNF